MDMKERMFNNKLLHSFTFMPSRIVHPKVDGLSFEAINNLPQNLNKPIGIAADPLRDSMRSLDEIHPSKDIQSLLMLTPGIYKRSTPPSSPIFSPVSDAEKTPFHPQKEPLDYSCFSEPSGLFFNVSRNSSTPSSLA